MTRNKNRQDFSNFPFSYCSHLHLFSNPGHPRWEFKKENKKIRNFLPRKLVVDQESDQEKTTRVKKKNERKHALNQETKKKKELINQLTQILNNVGFSVYADLIFSMKATITH